MSMTDLIRDLGPIRSGTVCDGADQLAERLCKELPFTVHEFPSGQECNGWIVPKKWDCRRATISINGDIIYDGNAHPLGVASYSEWCNRYMQGHELKEHLFFSEAHHDSIVYHCDWWYKPHARGWGMCAPKTFIDTLKDGALYYVDLQTSFTPGTMKVLEYVLPGKSEQSIVLNAHTCHPGCANDDLSGVAVGIDVMRYLALVKDRTYTYRLICAPEHYGSIFYLDRFGSNNLQYALFLESLGSSGQLALQESTSGVMDIDRALRAALRGRDHRTGPFRSIVGNDETCWDSAGHDVPCPSLSRCPFPEYHTSLDNADLMEESKLAEARTVVLDAFFALEKDCFMDRRFKGLVCLSNPKYDLYKPYFDPSIPGRRTISDEAKKWNRLMDRLPQFIDGHNILSIAEECQVRFDDLYDYLVQWRDKGLVTFLEGSIA